MLLINLNQVGSYEEERGVELFFNGTDVQHW